MELKKLNELAISETGYIFNPESGHSYTANDTAVFIIDNLKKEASPQDIIKKLCDEFDVDRNTAEQDTLNLIEQLTTNFLI